jgi:hypothetical protein
LAFFCPPPPPPNQVPPDSVSCCPQPLQYTAPHDGKKESKSKLNDESFCKYGQVVFEVRARAYLRHRYFLQQRSGLLQPAFAVHHD